MQKLITAAFFCIMTTTALATDIPRVITGPIAADVIDVYDADTFTVNAYPWPNQIVNIKIRLSGLDTPEKGYRAKCEKEAKLSKDAREYVVDTILNKRVQLTEIENGKYAGRVVAKVSIAGMDLTNMIMERGMAVLYDGGKKTKDWCK